MFHCEENIIFVSPSDTANLQCQEYRWMLIMHYLLQKDLLSFFLRTRTFSLKLDVQNNELMSSIQQNFSSGFQNGHFIKQ